MQLLAFDLLQALVRVVEGDIVGSKCKWAKTTRLLLPLIRLTDILLKSPATPEAQPLVCQPGRSLIQLNLEYEASSQIVLPSFRPILKQFVRFEEKDVVEGSMGMSVYNCCFHTKGLTFFSLVSPRATYLSYQHYATRYEMFSL